ncbi:MAG: hypothetical protein AMXMBFR84_49470 [Candidatus Hydrogenedentota bacterium]
MTETERMLLGELRILQSEIRDLRRRVGNPPVQIGGGGGGFAIAHYTDVFPEGPVKPTIISAPNGQAYFANQDSTFWRPIVKPTTATGIPGQDIDP